MTDPIADMVNTIRNAQAVQKTAVEVPFSQVKYAVAKILERHGFVQEVEFKGKKTKKMIEITLRYREGSPQIRGAKRVSKPGLRRYTAAQDIKRVRGGQGMAVLSTSKGLMADAEARKENVGGEILLEIW